MTTRSRITQLYSDQDMTVAGQSDALTPQRQGDEHGTIQIEMNQSPGAGSSGTIDLVARLSPDASWVIIDSINIVLFHTDQNQLITDVNILPQLRLDVSGPAGVTALTTANAWLQE